MDTAQLRALQAPVKQQYRENAATAKIPARAEARINQSLYLSHPATQNR